MDVVPAEQLTDEVVAKLWAQVSHLRTAHIAYRVLGATNVLLDGHGQPWLIDSGFSEASASPRRLAQDVALAFRLLSFWIPIIAGWLTFRTLRDRRII